MIKKVTKDPNGNEYAVIWEDNIGNEYYVIGRLRAQVEGLDMDPEFEQNDFLTTDMIHSVQDPNITFVVIDDPKPTMDEDEFIIFGTLKVFYNDRNIDNELIDFEILQIWQENGEILDFEDFNKPGFENAFVLDLIGTL